MSKPQISIDAILSKLAEESKSTQDLLEKGSDVLLGQLDTKIAPTPYDVVWQEDRVKLKHYKTPNPVKVRKPLLIVYALINRETMLDLQEGRSVVQSLLDAGIDLYMIDWGYPTRMDRFLTIDDHVNGYIDGAIDYIREEHGIDSVNLMGVCMGGAFSIMYSALHPEKVNSLITTVTPSNFDTDQGLLHHWTRDLDVDAIVDTYGNLSGDTLNFVFLLLNPARLMIDKYMGFVEHIDSKDFVENFIRMEKWIFDSPDVPGETYRQFIKDCYQKNLLIKSELELDGKRVDLKNVTMPVLNIYGKYDHLVPPEACEKLTSAVGSKDTEDLCLETGHIGIYVSSKCQKEFVPKIAGWLESKNKDKKKPSTKSKKKPANVANKKSPAKKGKKKTATVN